MRDSPPSPSEAEELLLEAVDALGGRGERNRIIRKATELGGFNDRVRDLQSGKRRRLENDFGHALSRLKRKGLLDGDGSGGWRRS